MLKKHKCCSLQDTRRLYWWCGMRRGRGRERPKNTLLETKNKDLNYLNLI